MDLKLQGRNRGAQTQLPPSSRAPKNIVHIYI